MLNSLTNLQSSLDQLTSAEKNKVNDIIQSLEKFNNQSKYPEGLNFIYTTLKNLQPNESQAIRNKIKHEIVKQYNTYIVYCFNHGKNENIQKLFTECGTYISNNILSYTIMMNNYACFLVKKNHIKQSKTINEKLHKINILDYLNNNANSSLEEIAKDCSNLGSIYNYERQYEDSLVSGMESLALNQINSILNNQTNQQISISYYEIGTQQEFLKRNRDSVCSFARAKKYIDTIIEKESDKNKKQSILKHFEFIHKIKTKQDDIKLIK